MVSNVEVYWKLSSSKMKGDQGWCIDDREIEKEIFQRLRKTMFFFLKKNYACTVRKIRYKKLRASFEMHARGCGGVNKFIWEWESVLWWNFHISMVSYFLIGVTHEKYKIAKSGKSMFFAVWMLVTRSLQGHFEMHTKGCSCANKFVQKHEFVI